QRCGRVSSGRRLCRSHRQGCQPCRPASHAVDEVRAGHQRPGGQGARPRRAADAACHRRRGDRMKRREFITLLGGAAAWPLAVRAQQPAGQARRIGVLMNGTGTEARLQSYLAAFVQGLHQIGWNEGQNVWIDIRWNNGDAALARTHAAQLIGLMPDVILAVSATNLMVIQQATNTVPVVFVQVSDPVAQGFVASVAKPGGNLTGFSMYELSIGGKWVDLLKAAAPALARVAVMFNPETSPQSKFFMRSVEAALPSLGVQAIAVPVRTTADVESAIQSFARQPNGGLIL